MIVSEVGIEGLFVIEPEIFADDRGIFLETFQKDKYEKLGIGNPFVQDNFSVSRRGVVRGLHFQTKNLQGKLVSCLNGKVLDVVVDLRAHSVTFGQTFSIILDSDRRVQLWIPPGFAHGFSVLSESAQFFYKCTAYYSPHDESGIVWNDPSLGIDWLVDEPIVSVKDAGLPTLQEALNCII